MFALLTGALLLNACGPLEGGAFTPLNAERPIAQLPEGLTLSANPTTLTSGDFSVQMVAHTPEAPGNETAKAALDARPASATLVSSLFTLKAQGQTPEQVFLSLITPSGVEAALLDMYAWDGQAWKFLPSEVRTGQRVATVSTLPQAVALFQSAPAAPSTMLRIEPAEVWPLNTNSTGNAILLGGVTAQADGSLGGVLPNLPPGIDDPLYPVITVDASNPTADAAVRAAHIETLVGLAVSGAYAGLALDYRNVPESSRADYSDFVRDLHTQLRAQNKTLWVYLDLPENGLPTGGYDWATLGANSDGVLARLPLNPQALGNGVADRALSWATGQVERGKLRLVTSALPVILGPSGPTLAPNANLADWNSVKTDGLPEPLLAGQPVTATLSNMMQYDPQAAALQVTAPEGSLYLTSPLTLRQRFTLAEKYRLGGVAAHDVFSPGVPLEMLNALADYRASAAVAQSQTGVLWTVKDASGVIAQGTAEPGSVYVFVPAQAGEYQIAAQVQGAQLGSAPIKIAEAVTLTPTVAPTTPVTGGGSGSNPTPQPTARPPSGGGGFVPPPPVVNTGFELGGQVPVGINHAAQMKQAGMTWVKFQVRGGGGDYIAAAKANGFKVLLSVIGDKSRVTDPAYWNEYAAWVGGLAAQGADAIEVWNEPNIDHEWPEGQIDGATYTQLLAKAYAAIKAANGGTLVISAGPAPTGAEAAFPGRVVNDDKFLRQMANANAANYFDCVGTHYNEGIISPTQTGGDPRDSFYSRYYSSMVDLYYNSFGGTRPVCFTELGYLTGEGYGPLPSFFAWAQNTTLAQQAQWLAEAASLSASGGKVRLMTIWNVDFTLYSSDPQAGYAIVRADGSCSACATLDAVMP
ncbi:MAG: hypothetical protein ACT4QE_11940 [Anaerolineales bacterium]